MYEAQGNKKEDLARIVSERHCLRLEALIKSVGKNGDKAEKVGGRWSNGCPACLVVLAVGCVGVGVGMWLGLCALFPRPPTPPPPPKKSHAPLITINQSSTPINLNIDRGRRRRRRQGALGGPDHRLGRHARVGPDAGGDFRCAFYCG
jgi:hypothetical protein